MRTNDTTPDPHTLPMTTLKKSLTLKQTVIYGVGVILGAGIYALIGEAAGIAGNSLWLSFILAAIIASFTALSYAELSSIFSKTAAEFIYVQETTKSKLAAFFVGYAMILTTIISAAAVALGFASYLKLFVPISPALIAIALVIVLSIINFKGIEQSARLNVVFTLIEAGGLIFIILIGASFVGAVDLFAVPSGADILAPDFFSTILSAAAIIFFAYLGFENIANIAEETKNPKKIIPQALLLSLLIATVIYILVSVVSVSVVPASELFAASQSTLGEEGPLALVATTAMNNPLAGGIFTIIALFATANTSLILLVVASRMIFGIAREKCLPKILTKIHKKNQTPTFAVILAGIIAILFATSGSIGVVANLTNMGVFLIFFAVNLSLVINRFNNRKKKFDKDQFVVPGNIKWFPVIPALGAVFCLYMFLTQFWSPIDLGFISMPIIVFGLIIFATSIPFYFIYRSNMGFFDKEI
jgi:APA family basic amino acid/polyamine antiporter